MFKMKNVTNVNNWMDLMANISGEVLHNETVKLHVEGSDEILVLYVFDNMYCVDVIDNENYLTINYLEFDSFDELLEEMEIAYSELL